MHDPGLRPRLATVAVPTLVLRGDSDGIATPASGEAYARSFTDARFEVVPEAGHLPQIERPAAALAIIPSSRAVGDVAGSSCERAAQGRPGSQRDPVARQAGHLARRPALTSRRRRASHRAGP